MVDRQTLTDGACLEAGGFANWLQGMRAVLRGERDADVPCGDCVGCCVSSYPIPLRPTDRVALELVPPEHLQLPPATGSDLARMGFREDGSCPMLCAGACSIYSDRPQTCRDYDCRIYAATGLLPDGHRPVIQARIGEWQFEFAGEHDAAQAIAVRSAAHFIREHHALFPLGMRAESSTAAAVLAVKCFGLFVDAGHAPGLQELPLLGVQRVIAAVREFDENAWT